MIETILRIMAGLIGKLISPAIFFIAGRKSKENEQDKEENERLKSRPRTDGDTVIRLREWRDKLRDKGK